MATSTAAAIVPGRTRRDGVLELTVSVVAWFSLMQVRQSARNLEHSTRRTAAGAVFPEENSRSVRCTTLQFCHRWEHARGEATGSAGPPGAERRSYSPIGEDCRCKPAVLITRCKRHS